VYEILSSTAGRCCAVPLFHHVVTFLQSPVDFWRTRGGHQNSRRGQGLVRNNRANNNPNSSNRSHSPVDNSFMNNDVGHHSTTMATIIANEDGDVTNELIQLADAGQWRNGSKVHTQEDHCPNQNESKITTEENELSTTQLTVTSNTKSGENTTLAVPSDTSQVTTGNKRTNGSLV
jgi:hypothetical protein